MSETADERADRLLAVGLDVAVQIRDDDPEAVARLLQALDRAELRDLVMLLAAAVDVDRRKSQLFRWYLATPRELRPCGTPAAARRHQRSGEPLCDACREALQSAWRARKRTQRGRRAA